MVLTTAFNPSIVSHPLVAVVATDSLMADFKKPDEDGRDGTV